MNAIYEETRLALHVIWRRRWLALAVAWAICMTGWLAISLIPNKYESRARLVVKIQSLLPGQMGITENDTQRKIDQIRQTLTSRENLMEVVRNTDIARQATSNADVAGLAVRLAKGIRIVAQPDNLFEISSEISVAGLSDAQNAQLAHDVVEKLINLFIAGNAADDRAEALRSVRFLDQEISRREAGLREAEAKRVAFDQKYFAAAPGTGSIDQRIAAIHAELATLEPNLASAQGSLAAINAQLASTPATIAMPGAPGGGSRRAQLEAQLAEARARGWTEEHPDVVALRAQLVRVGGEGGNAVAGSTNPAYLSMRSIQADRQATASSLAARKAQLQADLNMLATIQVREPGIAAEQTRLSRDYEVLKTQYDKLIADREDVRLRSDVANRSDIMQIRVIDPPSRPSLPSSPNRPLLLFVVFVLGLGGGVGVAWTMGRILSSYSTADHLARATGLTVLGSIPETLTGAQLAQRRQQLKWFGGSAGALAGTFLLLLVIEFVQRGLMA